jgi:hypothetical protein
VRRPVAVALLPLLLALSPLARAAGRRSRPLFEPTDLELEDPGTVEVDLQMGFIQASGPARLVVPDLELDVGLARAVELDVDASYTVIGPDAGPFALDHGAPDSLWGALKIGLLSVDGPRGGLAVGLQIGPKLPVAPGSHGLGGEALVLLGLRRGGTHLVLQLGALVDPAPAPGAERPRGVEAGLDLDQDLPRGFSITSELGGVRFWSNDADQLTATVGLAWAPSERLELSLVALVGLLPDGDHWGVLLGVSPKLGR